MKLSENLNRIVNEALSNFILKTGIPYFDNLMDNPEYFEKEKNISFRIVNISPERYIRECADNMETTFNDLIENRQDKSKDDLVYKIKQGDELYIPYIQYGEAGFNQEGLHRAIACYELGISTIPVLIVYQGKDCKDNLFTIINKLNHSLPESYDDFENLKEKVCELTNDNFHTEALLTICDYYDLQYNELNKIKEYQDSPDYQGLDMDMADTRYKIYQDIIKTLKEKIGEDKTKELVSCL